MSFQYGTFNANEVQPRMGSAGSHPVGIFLGTVSDAAIEPNNKGDGGNYVLTFKSDHGEIKRYLALWNNNETAVRIARENLSAICHAINYFTLNFDQTGGREIVGAPIMFEVGPQLVNSDPNDKNSKKVESPNLTEIKRVFSKEGRNPSRPTDAPVVPTEGGSSIPAAGPASSPPGAAGASWAAGAPPAAPTPPQAAPAASPPSAANGAAPAWAGGAPAATPAGAAAAGAPPWAR